MSKVFKNDQVFVPVRLTTRELSRDDEKQPSPNFQPRQNPAAAARTPSQEPTPPPSEPRRPAISPEEIQAMQQQAYQQGFNDASAGFEEKFTTTLNTFVEGCRELTLLRNSALFDNKERMINLVMAISKAIIREELTTKRNVVSRTLEAALQQAIQNDEYHITVHPDDLAVVEKMKPEIISTIRSLEHVVLKVDSQITRGGCLIESDTCSVDATIETQLENAGQFLLEHSEEQTQEDLNSTSRGSESTAT